jgi:hypothetical protein
VTLVVLAGGPEQSPFVQSFCSRYVSKHLSIASSAQRRVRHGHWPTW